MNILVSYNWLKEYLKTDLAPEELASRLSLAGPSVERIRREEVDFKNIFVGKILGIEKHPNADKLRLAEVDLGGKKIKVVCGGSNLRSGMKVAVASPGAKVRWHGRGELVELKPVEIRGVKSEGMICAAEEIGLEHAYPEESGLNQIIDLSDLPANPGTPLGEALGGRDSIFDLEVTTNRPDVMCIFGLAREAGAILKTSIQMPKVGPIKKIAARRVLSVKNSEPELCLRYQAVALFGIKIGPSPWWLKRKLLSVGRRPINNVVDITNFVLWEMGQPLHAFDYEKLSGHKIIVRRAKRGEKIKALDGNEYKLKENNLVIADAKRPIAIAGVMGGEATGVTGATKTIVLEAATFDPLSTRRTARELNLRSDSSNFFEKGLSTEGTAAAMMRAIGLMKELCGGTAASEIFDLRSKKYKPKEVVLKMEKARMMMGADIEREETADLLTRLGFTVARDGDALRARVPYWRDGDIEIEEDLIEEIARIYGYHRLPSLLPPGAPPPNGPDKIFYWENAARELAIAAGYDEILSYTIISKKMMEAAGETEAVKIANPLSSDMEYMRSCLFPGLLMTIAENEKNFARGKIFELGRVYLPVKKGELPNEELHFAGMAWGRNNLFYESKGFAEKFLENLGLIFSAVISDAHGGSGGKYLGVQFKETDNKNFHPARSLDIYAGKDYLGSFGEVHPGTVKNFNIDSRVGFFYFYLDEIAGRAASHKCYHPLPEYPGLKRDISFLIDRRAEYEKIKEAVLGVDALVVGVEVFDVYAEGIDGNKKSMALHLLFRSPHRTLEAKEADEIWEKIVKMLKKKFEAEVRR